MNDSEVLTMLDVDNNTKTDVDSIIIQQDIYPNAGVITKRNFNQHGQVEAVKIENETHTIMKNRIVLNQLPSTYYRIQIDGMKENLGTGNNLEKDEFRVVYESGMIFFNTSMEGQEITITQYYGIGMEMIPTSRIYIGTKEDGNITNTLYDMIKVGTNSITALQEVGGVLADGKATAQRLETDTANANTINDTLVNTTIPTGKSTNDTLNNTIDKANTENNTVNTTISNAKDEDSVLNTTIDNAKAEDSVLNTTISNAKQENDTLNTTISNAKDEDATLNKDIATGNSLHTELTNDIATGNKLNETINTLMPQAKDYTDKLNEAVDTGNKANNTLNETITNASKEHDALSNYISTAQTLYNNIDKDITDGNTLNTNLNNSITQGGALITNINQAISTATSSKKDLDKTNDEATQKQTALADLIKQASAGEYLSKTTLQPILNSFAPNMQ